MCHVALLMIQMAIEPFQRATYNHITHLSLLLIVINLHSFLLHTSPIKILLIYIYSLKSISLDPSLKCL